MTEEAIFLAALDVADPSARAAYLDKACGGDVQLRRAVWSLLAAHDKSGAFLDVPVAEQIQAGETTAAGEPRAAHAGVHAAATPKSNRTAGADAAADGLSFLDPPTRPGSLGQLGHYEVQAVLGRGGFGIVLKAFDETLQRVVAVKILAPELAATSPARKRFLREARAGAAVRHEHVVQTYAIEEVPLPYLVMEYIAGETLQQRLDRTGPLDLPEVLRIGTQIARGLTAAHEIGLVHRDVKPGNILLEQGAGAKVKLTDFGLARAADDASLTQSGVIAGTPLYIAPEQAQGTPIDQRSDLFSLGSVLYTLVTGRPPFRASTALAVLKRVCEDTPRPIREIVPEVPPWFCGVVARLHAKQPEDRFASAQEVADLLARCLAEIQQYGVVRSHADLPGSETPAALPGVPARAAHRAASSRARLVVAALALLLVAAGLGLAEATGLTQLRETVAGLQARHDSATAPPVKGTETPPAPGKGADAAAADARAKFQAVADRLRQLNPAFHGSLTPTVEGGAVTELEFETDNVNNIAPLAELTGLRKLDCAGSGPGKGKLANLAPLRNLKLTSLRIAHTRVADLSPLRGLPLQEVRVEGTPVPPAEVAALQKALPGCRIVTDQVAWELAVAALPAPKQVEVVAKKLQELNSEFDGQLTPTVEDDVVTGLTFFSDKVKDVSPVRALAGLKVLRCNGSSTGKGSLADLGGLKGLHLRDLACDQNYGITDLTPLQGMPLEGLSLWQWKGKDLAPLQGMPLKYLNIGGGVYTKFDLSPLKGMPLDYLILNYTATEDLSPLQGLPLRSLLMHHVNVTDLAPLKGMPLKHLECDSQAARDTKVLRSLTTLESINGQPITEFWKTVDGQS